MELGFLDLDLGGRGVRKGSDPIIYRATVPTLPPDKCGVRPRVSKLRALLCSVDDEVELLLMRIQ